MRISRWGHRTQIKKKKKMVCQGGQPEARNLRNQQEWELSSSGSSFLRTPRMGFITNE